MNAANVACGLRSFTPFTLPARLKPNNPKT
jgi:hypothetical protein